MLVDTWSALQNVTDNLTKTITEVPGAQMPDVSQLEGIFKDFKEINLKKVALLETV